MKVNPADRISSVEEYYFSQKLAQIDKMRQEGSDVINLGIGSPDQGCPQTVQGIRFSRHQGEFGKAYGR